MRIPIQAAEQLAKTYQQSHVIILVYDGKEQQVVTYGNTLEACAQAANGGNMVKRAAGWPASLEADPAPVRHLKKRVVELEAALAAALAD
jgi:hypothetical protein